MMGLVVLWAAYLGLPADSREATLDARPDPGSLAAVRRELQEEVEARRALADEVASLRNELFARRGGDLDAGRGDSAIAPGMGDDASRRRGAGSVRGEGPRPVFDEDALVEAGVPPARARRARELWEESVLDKLYLNDRAAREGWTDTQQHWRDLRLLDEQLRSQLNDNEYDEFLFASGKDNRVVVQDVTSGSAGADAGLRPGDVFVRYDGKRVFETEDLRQATRDGSAGESVSVEVERDGHSIRMTIPRGPVGALVEDEKRPPL